LPHPQAVTAKSAFAWITSPILSLKTTIARGFNAPLKQRAGATL
jgi:hypothetical protein